MIITSEELHDKLCSHLELSIEYGGFAIGLNAIGGCSCDVCSFLRGHLVLEYYKENKKWPPLPPT